LIEKSRQDAVTEQQLIALKRAEESKTTARDDKDWPILKYNKPYRIL